MLSRVTLDRTGTGGATERRARPITMDEMKDLRGVVRIWTRLTHRPSDDPGPVPLSKAGVNCFSRRDDL